MLHPQLFQLKKGGHLDAPQENKAGPGLEGLRKSSVQGVEGHSFGAIPRGLAARVFTENLHQTTPSGGLAVKVSVEAPWPDHSREAQAFIKVRLRFPALKPQTLP